MQYDTVEYLHLTPTMRLIECSGLDATSADMHLSRGRAHLTFLDGSLLSRALRRVEYSNSLLVTQMMAATPQPQPTSSCSASGDSAAASAAAAAAPAADVRAVTLQRLKGLFETEPCRAPFELVEAVLQPSTLTMAELDGDVRMPRSELVTLRQLYACVPVSKHLLVRYLRSRGALFCPLAAAAVFPAAADDDGGGGATSAATEEQEEAEEALRRSKDYYVRFLEPALVKSAVVEICKFLNTLDARELFAPSGRSERFDLSGNDNGDEDGAAALQGGTQAPAASSAGVKQEGAAAHKTTQKAATVNFVDAASPHVEEHFSGAQYPVVYEIAWQYMTSVTVNGIPPAGKNDVAPRASTTSSSVRGEHINFARVVPILAQEIIRRPGEISKQSLGELWESCRAEYWFLSPASSTSSPSSLPAPAAAAATTATPASPTAGAGAAAVALDETLLFGYFTATEPGGVVYAPLHAMPFSIVGRIAKLFTISNKWDKQELYAYLLPIGDSKKAVDAVLGKRCRDVKDKTGKIFCYLV